MTDYLNLVNFSIKAVLKKHIIKSKPFTARFKTSQVHYTGQRRHMHIYQFPVQISFLCYWKVLAIDTGINQIPIFNKSIGNTDTNTHFQKVLQYSGSTEKSIANTSNTNTILQY